MSSNILIPLEAAPGSDEIGGKGRQIRWLRAAGFQVPKTWVITADYQTLYLQNRSRFLSLLARALNDLILPDRKYAVRSSASVEDGDELSFAGQFTTKLDVSGVSNICQAVEQVYQGSQTPGLRSYLDQSGVQKDPIAVAVLIQEMVLPIVSGVAFSKNPLTGLNEVIIEAFRGRGDAFIQGGETPERWVSKWGDWIDRPDQSAIDPNLIQEVVDTTRKIEQSIGSPVDIEWVYDGSTLYWLQARPITSLRDINIYSNRISREFLPGIIKPLVWSINTPLVNGAWVNLFTELIGPNDIAPEDLAKSFYYRAYFNMGAVGRIFEILGFPKESLELLMGLEGGGDRPTFKPTTKTFQHIPRMLSFLLRRLRFSDDVEHAHPKLRAEFDRFASGTLENLSSQEILALIDALLEVAQEAAWFNILVPLFQSIYTALFKWQIEKLGYDFAVFDLNHNHPALDEFDPNAHLNVLHASFVGMDEDTQNLIRSTSFETLAESPDTRTFHQEITRFLERFGHLSDSGNDFSIPPWRENPALVVTMAMEESRAARGSPKVGWEDVEISALRRFPLRFLYNRARRYHLYRESISSLYTLGYGLFRNYFLELGDRLVKQTILKDRNDIFYITIDEIKDLFDVNSDGPEIQRLIDGRKAEIEAAREFILPEVIYGDQPPPLEADTAMDKLKGIPTSRGYYRGRVTVVESSQEFDKVSPGDVLVIPYSDVAWTPLFTKAGAVIAESGGILSHSSIVAREFNIPCVVSVNQACRLPERTTVTVDGYTGVITIHS